LLSTAWLYRFTGWAAYGRVHPRRWSGGVGFADP
jgi:hypothetical protein